MPDKEQILQGGSYMQHAFFRFHGSLNDFLLRKLRHLWLQHAFNGSPAVKDSIEALGIPHPEVNFIVCNGSPVPFHYQLQPDDQVEVYPLHRNLQPEVSLSSNLLPPRIFALDVHLGRLARNLRLLGFDSVYRNDFTDAGLAQLAASENRIVLTRDVGLLKQKIITRGYWLRSQNPEVQTAEVVNYFQLWPYFAPFSRCLVCNAPVEPVAKEAVADILPPNTKLFFREFYQCCSCRRVYWKGSHYERMIRFLAQFEERR